MTAALPSLTKPNPNWARLPLFNRKNWTRLRFGDIVENVNERVEPSTAAEAIYVGLDDLDSGSLHIRRWGKGSDVIGTKLGFRKGDVIFGRRRAYQRKLAVAEVDGICSAHAMVARAKPKVILPEFLPFLMMSDKFMNRAVDISVGSLSPTINWTTLKLEEFDLPPLDQQRRIAEILWAVDEAAEKNLQLRSACETAYTTAINRILFDKRNEVQRVGDISRINNATLSESKTAPEFEFQYIDIGSVIAPKKLGPLETYRFSNAPSRARRRVANGDILVSTVRPNLKAFLRVNDLTKEHVASTGFAVVTPRDKVIGNLLFHAFFSPQFMTHCDGRVTGTSYPAMNAKDVGDFTFYIPQDKAKCLEAADFMNELENNSNLIEAHIARSSELLRQMVESFMQTKT